MHFNNPLRKRGNATFGTASTGFRSSKRAPCFFNPTLRSQKKAAAMTATSYSTAVPPMKATQQPSSRSASTRARITKEHSRVRSRTRSWGRRRSTSPPTHMASPFSSRLQRPPSPKGISACCKYLLSVIREKLHLLKFNFLFEVGSLRRWLTAKLGGSKSAYWLNKHMLRKSPEPRRPFFSRGRSSYDEAQYQAAAGTALPSRNGCSGSRGEEVKGRIRRL